MKIFKAGLVFTIAILVVFGVLFGLIRLVNADIVSFPFSENSNQTEEEQGVNITLANLFGTSIDGDLLILNRYGNSSTLVQYKISTGRQKQVAKLENIEIENPQLNIQLFEGSIYLLGKEGAALVLLKIENKPNAEVEKVFESENSRRLLGLKVFEGQVMFTGYLENAETGLLDFEIYQYDQDKEELSIVSNGSSELLPLVSEYSTKDNIFLEEYSLEFQTNTSKCLAIDLSLISCLEASGLDEQYLSNVPTIVGYPAGEGAAIKLLTKKEIVTILEGSFDKIFSSLVKFGNDIYFISGDLETLKQVEVPGEPSQQKSVFEEFEPVFLEKFNLEKSVRTELSDLPASSKVEIASVQKGFVILSVVQSGSNSLWMYNTDKDSLEKIDDIQCEQVSSCDNYFLSLK